MNGKEDAAFYKDPANLQAGQRVTPKSRPSMKGHVPIRFPEDVIAQVKLLAERDGLTVSSWIRTLVLHELERRSAPTTGHAYWASIKWHSRPPVESPRSVSPVGLHDDNDRPAAIG